MGNKQNNNSVGIVEPKTSQADKKSLKLDCGKVLDDFSLVYETYGELNKEK